MSKEFLKYREELNRLVRRTKFLDTHIIFNRDFLGFSTSEIWGEFDDFDYEKWLKEQE